jgi:hypothetical protein
MPENYESRPERPCMGCGKRDKAPRDVVTLPDGNAAYYHWDCHVMIANCEVCKATLAALGTGPENDGLKDDRLVAAYHEKVADVPFDERPEIFTTEAAVPQELPNAN